MGGSMRVMRPIFFSFDLSPKCHVAFKLTQPKISLWSTGQKKEERRWILFLEEMENKKEFRGKTELNAKTVEKETEQRIVLSWRKRSDIVTFVHCLQFFLVSRRKQLILSFFSSICCKSFSAEEIKKWECKMFVFLGSNKAKV